MVHASTQKQFEQHKGRATAKLFTPNMVFVASWFGGLLAGCILIACNYMAIGQKKTALKTMAWAIGGVVLTFVLGYFIPSFVSGAGIATGIAIGLKHWSKYAFNCEYPKASWWIAILVSILNLIFTICLIFCVSIFGYIFLGVGKPEVLETYINPPETRQVMLTRASIGDTKNGPRYRYSYRAVVIGNEQEKKIIFYSSKRPTFTGWLDKETIEYIDGFNKCTTSLFSSSKPVCKEDASLKHDISRRIIDLDQEAKEDKQVKNPTIHKATNYLKDTQIKQGH